MKQPLVSLTIVTYNSSRYIVEALDSAKAQTYKNIELIISDDCSQDDTVEICRKWLDENGERFARTVLLEAPENTGVSANFNRAIAESRGEWVKVLAGDDLFLPTCVEDNLNFIQQNPEAKVVFSVARTFKMKNGKRVYLRQRPKRRHLPYFQMSAAEQLKQLYAFCFLPAPTLFIEGEIVRSCKFDERFRNIEDYPMWIKLTKKGYKLHFFNTITIWYRITDSLSKHVDRFYNVNFMETHFAFLDSIYEETLKYHPKVVRQREIDRKVYYFTIKYLNNKRNLFTRGIRKIAKKIISFNTPS